MIYLASALILMWLIVGGYLLYMLARQSALEKELRSLEVQLQSREDAD